MSGINNKKTVLRGLTMICVIGAFVGFISCANSADDKVKTTKQRPTPPEDVPTVGLNVCTTCHTGETNQWMTGQHGNYESWDPLLFIKVDLGLDNTGFPYYADFPDDTCVRCHDPLNDGHHLTAEWTGNAPRPVIGCESCHGGGANHYGIGEIPFPNPDHERCGQCHNSDFPESHLQYHPNGANVVENYEASPHLESVQATCVACHEGGGEDKALSVVAKVGNVSGKEKPPHANNQVEAICSRCHTDEGFKKYLASVPGSSSHDAIVAALENEPPIKNASPVECRTCHDSHVVTADTLPRLPDSEDSNGNYQSREFNTCTACHQLTNPDGTVMADAFHDASVNTDNPEQVLTETHAAVPGDIRQNSGASEVPIIYVKKADPNACAKCHNVHGADTTINEDWRESGHGDLLGDPWIHYNWKDMNSGSPAAGRQACQRCHTSTGFSNFANNPATYNPANNNFSYLIYGTGAGTPADNGQMEVLYCWACHTQPQVGILRNPGPITPGIVKQSTPAPTSTYKYVDMTNTNITFPDVNGSNVCMGCHTGRETGGNVWNSAGNFANLSFVNSHYLTAGANVFSASGFEYNAINASLDYSSPTEFKHDVIGSAAAPGTGDNGPCVGCHMKTDRPHLFEPVVEDDATETITAIRSVACITCHTEGGVADVMTVSEFNADKDLYKDAMEAFNVQLRLRSYYFSTANPYFFTADYDPTYNESTASPHCQKNLPVKNWQTDGTTTFTWNAGTSKCDTAANVAGTAGTGKPNMGAAFNFNLLEHDPGAFVHNYVYAKRLIYDSIDWLDDNSLNGTARATLAALDGGTNPYKAGACEYLFEDATCASGDRP